MSHTPPRGGLRLTEWSRLNPLGIVNIFLLRGASGWWLVDSGWPQTAGWLMQKLRRLKIAPAEIRGLLLTHGHADHAGAAAKMQRAGVPVWCGAREESFLRGSSEYRYGAGWEPFIRFGEKQFRVPKVKPDHIFKEGEWIDGQLQVVETPGHTPGHVGFWQEKTRTMVSGDILLGHLHRPWGPSPLFTPDMDAALNSLERLLDFQPQIVLPGHGANLTLAHLQHYQHTLQHRCGKLS